LKHLPERGSRWATDNILTAQPDTDLRVLAVWQAVQGDGSGDGEPDNILDPAGG
jgi:hypothetical protein